MEIESNTKKYMNLDEYEKEFATTGRKDFYAFLEEKKQEAINSGDNELAEHIENIYNQAIKEEQEYDEMAQYEADKKRKEDAEKRQGEYEQEESNGEDYIVQLTTEDLSTLSIEELQKIVSSNQEEILANEEEIKKSLVDKILGQQQTIAKQKEEIDRLKSQKEL